MTREIKANLIFLAALIVLVSPGFYILMKKRLNGPSKPIFMADPVPVTAAYNQPPPVPPTLPRIEPKLAKSWIVETLQADAGASARLMRTSDDEAAGPVMGDRFITQGIAQQTTPAGTTIRLLAWDARTQSVGDARVQGSLNGKPVDGGATEVRQLDVPVYVRHTLQDAGFIDPPTKVGWIICKFSGPVDRLEIGLPGRKTETMTLPPAGSPS
ncbi:MAG: hypothetical protein ACTHLZ_12400 [Tepidisphaeraceae bacterium]